ncbi:hypothetical protein HDV04_001273 [Boothiomyces sp. JEL0838]|nr:hypothetical protein HDV04_001273 [Boothiomyces sp. JEL0838]
MRKLCRFIRRYSQGIIIVNQSYMGSLYNDVSTINPKPQFSITQLESMLKDNRSLDDIWKYYQCITHDYDSLKQIPSTVYSLLFQSISRSPNMDKIDYLIRDMKMISKYPTRTDFHYILDVCKQLNRDVLLQIERWKLDKSKAIELLELLASDMNNMDVLDQIPLIIRIISFTLPNRILTWQISGKLIEQLPHEVMLEVCTYLHSTGVRLPDLAYTELLKENSIEALEILIENEAIRYQSNHNQLFLKCDILNRLDLASKLWDKMIPQFKSSARVFTWDSTFIYIEMLMKYNKHYEASLVFKRFFSLQNGQVWTFKEADNLIWIAKYCKLCEKYECKQFADEYDYIKWNCK